MPVSCCECHFVIPSKKMFQNVDESSTFEAVYRCADYQAANNACHLQQVPQKGTIERKTDFA